MSRAYLGIDVGEKGFLTVQRDGVFESFSIKDHTLYEVASFVERVYNENEGDMTCVIEDVHAIFGSSAKGTFNFGFNKGYLVGIMCAKGIPYTLVPPKTWQLEIWTNGDKEYKYTEKTKVVDTKNTSINACRRLFPTLDLRRTPACKTVDDNKVDSILMSEYARRKNL